MLDRRAPIIPYLDGWRGLAIIAVLVCHFGPGALGWLGQFGVQMFFVLSGYLMGQLLFVKDVALPDFFARRFSRVIPTFFLFIGCMYVYASYFQAKPAQLSLEEVLATLFFLRTYLPEESSIWIGAWPIGNVWSLNVEEHSYVVLAILAFVARKLDSRRVATLLLGAAVAASIVVYYSYASSPPPGASPWALRSECAAIGLLTSALLCQFRGNGGSLPFVPQHALVPLAFICLGMFFISAYRLRGGQVVIGPICLAIAVNFLAWLPQAAKDMLSYRPFIWFGKRSFSIYLWQQPCYRAVADGDLSAPAGIALALGLGLLSFHLFEDPLRISLNRAWSRRSKAGAAGPAQRRQPGESPEAAKP